MESRKIMGREAQPCGQDPPKSASSTKGSHKDSPVPKRRKAEGKGSGTATEHKVSRGSLSFVKWDVSMCVFT